MSIDGEIGLDICIINIIIIICTDNISGTTKDKPDQKRQEIAQRINVFKMHTHDVLSY